MQAADPEEERARIRAEWERAASGWARQADRIRAAAMPVSAWMVEHAELSPGQRVLELAAGPGDTGFMAAELVAPFGVLITSDGAEAMLDVARERARQTSIENVEFKQLELEWIDLPTASVDVILCRWGLMLCTDVSAALSECRRVLRPGGRLIAAVWAEASANPWISVPSEVLVARGLAKPASPDSPGPFALSDPIRLRELLEDAGFTLPLIERVELEFGYRSVPDWVGEKLDLSEGFRSVWSDLDGSAREAVREAIAERGAPWQEAGGSLLVPGRTLALAANA